MANQKVKVLRVVAKKDGFRRAGFEFGKQPVDVVLADLKKQQIAAIKEDPSLMAHETEVEAPESAGAK